MKHLQHWFDLIAGISQDEHARLEQARRIFNAPGPDIDTLQTPACWRRSPRVFSH